MQVACSTGICRLSSPEHPENASPLPLAQFFLGSLSGDAGLPTQRWPLGASAPSREGARGQWALDEPAFGLPPGTLCTWECVSLEAWIRVDPRGKMREVGRAPLLLLLVVAAAKTTGYFVKAEAGSFDPFSPSCAPRDAAGAGTPRPRLCSPPSAPGCEVSAVAPEARPRAAAPPLARSLPLPPPRRRCDSAKLSERAQAARRAPGREREPEQRGPDEGRAAGLQGGGGRGACR